MCVFACTIKPNFKCLRSLGDLCCFDWPSTWFSTKVGVCVTWLGEADATFFCRRRKFIKSDSGLVNDSHNMSASSSTCWLWATTKWLQIRITVTHQTKAEWFINYHYHLLINYYTEELLIFNYIYVYMKFFMFTLNTSKRHVTSHLATTSHDMTVCNAAVRTRWQSRFSDSAFFSSIRTRQCGVATRMSQPFSMSIYSTSSNSSWRVY